MPTMTGNEFFGLDVFAGGGGAHQEMDDPRGDQGGIDESRIPEGVDRDKAIDFLERNRGHQGRDFDYHRILTALASGQTGSGPDAQDGPAGGRLQPGYDMPPGWGYYPGMPGAPGAPGGDPGGDRGNIPPDLLGLRDVLSSVLSRTISDRGGLMPRYPDPLNIDAGNFLSEGMAGYRDTRDIVRDLVMKSSGGLDRFDRSLDRRAGGDKAAAFRPAYTALEQMMDTGGAPDITRALAAIRTQGLQDIDRFRAEERERFGEMGLSSGSDVAEAVGRGTSQGISDMMARQESLITSVLGDAANRKLGAAQTYGTITGTELSSILAAAQGRQQSATTAAGSLLPATQGVAGQGLEWLGLTERNLQRDYGDWARSNPDLMEYAIAYATGYPPVKPTVGGGMGTGAALGAAGITAAGMSAASWLPMLLGAFSSRDLKEDIRPLDTSEVTSRAAELPIYRWRYKGDKTEHLGPIAEEFSERFGVGDGKTLHLADVMGVLLAVNREIAARHVGSGKSEGARRNA